jgi:hypothetical protein
LSRTTSRRHDRTAIANDVTAQDVSGQFTAHVFDTQSRHTDNGVASASIETASQDDDEPLFQAGWMLYKYKRSRGADPVSDGGLSGAGGQDAELSTVLAASVGTRSR